jgi:hypothetical protein
MSFYGQMSGGGGGSPLFGGGGGAQSGLGGAAALTTPGLNQQGLALLAAMQNAQPQHFGPQIPPPPVAGQNATPGQFPAGTGQPPGGQPDFMAQMLKMLGQGGMGGMGGQATAGFGGAGPTWGDWSPRG